MFAFVSNEYKAIVYTAAQLDFLESVFSYPKYVRVNTQEEANRFFAQNDRSKVANIVGDKKFGRRTKVGYISVEYFISNNSIYCNVDTSKFGYIRVRETPSNVAVESAYGYMKLKFKNIKLDDSLISNHCLAISNILKFYGDMVNIELKLPDISVYLALTAYTGKNFIIRNLQSLINSRFGSTYYTIRR